MIKQLKEELPFALFLLMVGLAFALAYVVLSGLWLLLSAGQPASWYLLIALIVMAVGWAKSASSVWFVLIRDTALAAAIGFALLAVVVAWFIKGVNQGDMNDETVRMLANSEFYFVQWHEKLETFGQFAAVLVPLSLVGLTLAGSGISRSVWARNIFWLQRVSKYLLEGVTVAASFSMFGSDAILGKAASAERTHLKAVMRYVTEKEHENLLKVAQLRVETAAMTDISTNQKKFIAETIGAVWNVPKLTQEGRVILAIQAGREVLAKSSAPVISNDHDGRCSRPGIPGPVSAQTALCRCAVRVWLYAHPYAAPAPVRTQTA
jgi:hypothetical protein